jgi:hypothetical protein
MVCASEAGRGCAAGAERRLHNFIR